MANFKIGDISECGQYIMGTNRKWRLIWLERNKMLKKIYEKQQ
jgi:hypothetical protein